MNKRQDGWTQEEDKLLAEVVLRLIKEGGTQLQAFEEVGKKLSRTSAACGFRWNSYVRKQYKSDIETAKSYRKQLKKELANKEEGKVSELKEKSVSVKENELGVNFDEVLHYLKDLNSKAFNYKEEAITEKKRVKDLEETIYGLMQENKNLQSRVSELSNSHKDLVGLMEKARQMFILERK